MIYLPQIWQRSCSCWCDFCHIPPWMQTDRINGRVCHGGSCGTGARQERRSVRPTGTGAALPII